MENMLNLKAIDYGLEPNVTGFEEAVNLSYLDGKREGISEGKKDGRPENNKKIKKWINKPQFIHLKYD